MSRFLVGNAHLQMLGGSETFTFAMVEELVRLRHEVDVICPGSSQGAISDALHDNFSIEVNGANPSQEYDAAFLSHNTTVEMLFRLFPHFDPAKVIQTIHGQYSPLEMPYHDGHRMIQFVTISDELREIYPYARTVMNGVNLERFKPGEKIPGSVLSMCQSLPFNEMLGEICGKLGLPFSFRDKFVNPIWNIEDELATAEIAIGIGRSAIEAMACGCAVLVADHRPYQGPLTDGWSLKPRTNYSGRGDCTFADKAHMRMCLQIGQSHGTAGHTEVSRRYATEHHDIRKQVQKYLEVVNVK